MSAGTGIRHSEYNHEDVETRIFQIWIIPTRTGDEPAWGSKPFPKGDRSGQFITLASGFEDDGDALPIRTDARVLGATLKADRKRVVEGKSVSVRVDLGGSGIIKKKNKELGTDQT